MKKEIALLVAAGCAATFAATNYDLLGRNGSKMNSPMVYKNVDYTKVKKNEQQRAGAPLGNKVLAKRASGLNGVVALQGAYSTEPLAYSGRGGYHLYLKKYLENGSSSDAFYGSMSAGSNSYLNDANSVFKPVNLVQNYTPSNLVLSNAATLMYGFEVNEQYDYNAFDPTSFWDVEYGNRLKRGDIWWFDNGYSQCEDCADVGLYMDADSYPVRLDDSKTVSYVESGSINNISHHELEVPASKAYSILQATTKNTTIFVTNQLLQSPASKTPQVYVGLHNRPNAPGDMNAATYYSTEARDLDNYIYDNRTVDVVAAGNYWIRNNSAKLTAQAHAANAVTVGAIDAANGRIADYTSTRTYYCAMGIGHCSNGAYAVNGSKKPEIYNYSEFFMPADKKSSYVNWFSHEAFPYSPNYEGTETAASYTANMVSALLRANPFYRWHPEVVKALLIASGEININTPYPHSETPATTKIPTYKSVVSNRFHNDYFHQSRYWIGYWPRLTTQIVGLTTELRFTVKRPADKHNFSAAIAWLSSGNDIANYGKLPQNFDLYVYENTTSAIDNIEVNNYKVRSTSENNAFEKVSFYSNAQYLTFRIVLMDEDDRSENKLQAVLGFDLASAN